MKLTDDRIIKTYIWHLDKCFFVSTIERTSSALNDPGPRYNETMVWEWDWNSNTRGDLLGQFECRKGSIQKHQDVVGALFTQGKDGLKESE